jgi:hypothetical protein
MRSRCVVIVIAVANAIANAIANAVGVIAVAVRFGCGDALAQIARNKTNNTRHVSGKCPPKVKPNPATSARRRSKKASAG